jgi:RNA polymerase sigma-70 factor (ECF subfamily)
MSDDDFATLRLLHRDKDLPPEVVDATLERTRLRFEAAARTAPARLARSERPARNAGSRRTTHQLRPALLTGGALVVAGALVTSGIGITHWSSPDAAAAATLREAARAAAADRAPTGAYTRVVETERALGYASSDGEHYDEGYLAPTTSTTWVPSDVSGTWVRVSWSGPATTFYGGAAARKAAADDYATEAHRDDPRWERATGGNFTVGELGGKRPGVLTPADIANLPREPGALVRRIETATRPVDTTDAEQVFDTIQELLRTGLVPADLRAGMYKALATLPGIVVTEKQVSLEGRIGTAISLPVRTGTERRDVIVDPTDGTYLGERTVQTSKMGSIPAGCVIDSVAVRSAPVNNQP